MAKNEGHQKCPSTTKGRDHEGPSRKKGTLVGARKIKLFLLETPTHCVVRVPSHMLTLNCFFFPLFKKIGNGVGSPLHKENGRVSQRRRRVP